MEINGMGMRIWNGDRSGMGTRVWNGDGVVWEWEFGIEMQIGVVQK